MVVFGGRTHKKISWAAKWRTTTPECCICVVRSKVHWTYCSTATTCRSTPSFVCHDHVWFIGAASQTDKLVVAIKQKV
ncbi:hypothetical protein PP740_gp046 [Stenotrophomonas phage Philippe]|uniref:Uncharacterized protein n=1 Tax=Stenotrophomonas phage Philippe TaxID=2859655 RepID=A0AAE8BI42_9CAUD|nr:hypothetical protein PP740_gp046 [Stenotrophomonas phage Philippe]QYW02245.1 hypothetical protein CPT_Philippe_046 [Stenotrophomonas phage Philippe]